MTDEELRMLADINRKVSRYQWVPNVTSNIIGNAIWDGAKYLFRLVRRL